MRTIFRGESISFGYTKQQLVLKNLAITIEDQSIFGIVGAVGAGKTTLAKVMLGLEKSTAGKMIWFNELMNASTNRRVGYVPHELALIYDLTVYENVLFFGKLYRYRGQRLRKQVEQALQLVGLWDIKDQQLAGLSEGQLQRLNIACGIVHEPDVVIFDEATSLVPSEEKQFIIEIVRQLHDLSVTIIYISSDLEEIEQLCTHVAILKDGTCFTQEKFDTLKEDGVSYNIDSDIAL